MNIHIDGTFTNGRKKPCKYCRNFFMWGIGEGYCTCQHENKMCHEHCKYYKRDAKTWTKDGKCKFDENLLYV